ncbi:MAG: SLBB domain-containing protein [Actinobacteria bacterium]|nr:SLBB domain-containing protein [Actinomycetota bacterium]
MNRLLPDEAVPDLEAYLAGDGGAGLTNALDRAPEDVIEEVAAAGLRGRGGAGFPTATKWRGVLETAAESDSPVYLVANAAEGEPGTYKDRTLIEADPYAFLEGVMIAMYATGARQAFVGIKEKFTRPVERLGTALTEMREAGWRGADRIEIHLGPDEYLFGEEKAMLEVIEGKLPLPRILPPYQTGLFATTTTPNPTVVNNVESYVHVARILAHGADWFRETGTDDSPGSMLFTVVGDVANPGVYELPLGTPLRTLLVDIAGASDVKAVYSGTSNTVITPDQLDTPLTFDDMSEAGTGLGSGGFVVYDSRHCIVKVLLTLSNFLAVESCGQCNACKLGTGEITDLLAKVDRGEGTQTDLEEILKRTHTVTDQNRCYLPVGEQIMVGSTVERFVDEFVAHAGTPCPSDRDVPTPLIDDIDEDTGEVTYHPRYHLKQADWSYADEEPADERLSAITTPRETP